MKKMERGDKIYLDKENTKESGVNAYLDCRDGIIEVYEYEDESGYGAKTRLFLCENTKHEAVSLIRQTYNSITKEWHEQQMDFDSDSFKFLEGLIKGKHDELGGKYTEVKNYNDRFEN